MELQRAWMLHSRPYKEQSVIAEFFVENHGRIAMVVRGVRKARSAHAALLQPFNSVLLSWQGRSELKNLRSIEPLTRVRLAGNALYCGFYINELLLRAMIPGQDIEGISELYPSTIHQLAVLEGVPDPVLRRFELTLLQLTGYLPDLTVDTFTGKPVLSDQCYGFQQEQGVFLIKDDIPVEVPPIARFSGELLLALSRQDFNRPDYFSDYKRFVRQALQPIVGDRPLESRRLFQTSQKPVVS